MNPTCMHAEERETVRQDLSGIWAAASEQLLTYPLTQPVRQALVAAMYGGTEPSQVSSHAHES